VRVTMTKLGKFQAGLSKGGRTRAFNTSQELFEDCRGKVDVGGRWRDKFAVKSL
jgi:hypothetical protein